MMNWGILKAFSFPYRRSDAYTQSEMFGKFKYWSRWDEMKRGPKDRYNSVNGILLRTLACLQCNVRVICRLMLSSGYGGKAI